jgi:hypothetical protein
MSIPTTRRPFYRGTAFWSFVADLTLATSAVAAATLAVRARQRSVFGLEGAVAALAYLAALVKGVLTWREKAVVPTHHDLEGCLYTLHRVLLGSAGGGHDPTLRLTLHIPVDARGTVLLEQVIDYVSDDPDRRTGQGRRFSPRSGIIGQAFRTGTVFVATRESEDLEQFVQELIDHWHYTLEDTKALDLRARSFIAVPLPGADDRTAAVLYVDSTKKDYFTANRRQLILDACRGIALFIGRRYNS